MKKGSRNLFSNKKSQVNTTVTTSGGGGGGNASVQNSDASYNVTVPGGNTLVLDDNTYNLSIDGVLDQTSTGPSIKTQNIIITLT